MVVPVIPAFALINPFDVIVELAFIVDAYKDVPEIPPDTFNTLFEFINTVLFVVISLVEESYIIILPVAPDAVAPLIGDT